jgi:tol-pal system protein YbgF
MIECKQSSRPGRLLISVAPLVLLIALFAGCATKQDVIRVDENVNRVRNDQLLLKARLERIDSLLTASADQDNQLRVDVGSSLSSINDQVSQLQNQLSDMQQLVYKLSQRVTESGPAQPVPQEPVADSTDTTQATDTTAPLASTVDCRRLWDNAFQDMYRGQYELAISGFSDYLKYCPKGDLSDNSQLWIAEAYYEMGQNEKAIQEYNKLLKDYPESEKRATAYFKLGRTYEKMGDTAKALEYYLVLKDEFPGSVEFDQVKDKIEEWQKAKKE